MNVDGAFILAETCRKTSVLLFADSGFINDSHCFWEDVCLVITNS